MRRCVFILIGWVLFSCGGVWAEGDLYYWTDEKGVRHFTNIPPDHPEDALGTKRELPYDQKADDKRMGEYERWRDTESQRQNEIIERRKAEEDAKKQEAQRLKDEEKKRQDELQAAKEAAGKEKIAERIKADKRKEDKSVFRKPAK